MTIQSVIFYILFVVGILLLINFLLYYKLDHTPKFLYYIPYGRKICALREHYASEDPKKVKIQAIICNVLILGCLLAVPVMIILQV